MTRIKLSHYQQAFAIQQAIRVAVATARERGIPVDLTAVTTILCSAFPDAAEAPGIVELALKNAAENGNVRVRRGFVPEGDSTASEAA